MKTEFENEKLNYCKDELKPLLQKLVAGYFKTTAETIFDHIAHTGVDTDLHPERKIKPTFDEFMSAE